MRSFKSLLLVTGLAGVVGAGGCGGCSPGAGVETELPDAGAPGTTTGSSGVATGGSGSSQGTAGSDGLDGGNAGSGTSTGGTSQAGASSSGVQGTSGVSGQDSSTAGPGGSSNGAGSGSGSATSNNTSGAASGSGTSVSNTSGNNTSGNSGGATSGSPVSGATSGVGTSGGVTSGTSVDPGASSNGVGGSASLGSGGSAGTSAMVGTSSGGTASSTGPGTGSSAGMPASSGMGTGTSNGAPDAGALEQTLAQFCAGNGSVGPVQGGGADACTGQLAQDTFQYAVCACENIAVNAQLLVDAFDSATGLYGAASPDGGVNIRNDGHLGMNVGPMTLGNKLTVKGSAHISGGGIQVGPQSTIATNLYAYGNATTIPNTALTVGRNAFIRGNVPAQYTINGDLRVPPAATVGAQVGGTVIRQDFPDSPACPCAPNQVLDIAGLTAFGATHNDNTVLPAGLNATSWATGTGPNSVTLPCGRFYVSNILVNNTFNLTAAGRVVLFVDGDFNTGGINIAVQPGAELDLFVNGNLTINSAATFGSPSAPSKVRTYVAGNLTLQASATFAGNIYAPNAAVDFSGATQVYGSLFVRHVRFNSNSQVHYDSAIRRAGDVCLPQVDGGMAGGADAGGGSMDGDAGTMGSVDAGTMADAGSPPIMCTGICDKTCGTAACVEGGGGLVCMPCTGDLDCCTTDLCNPTTGECTNNQ